MNKDTSRIVAHLIVGAVASATAGRFFKAGPFGQFAAFALGIAAHQMLDAPLTRAIDG